MWCTGNLVKTRHKEGIKDFEIQCGCIYRWLVNYRRYSLTIHEYQYYWSIQDNKNSNLVVEVKWYHQCVEMEVFSLAFHQLWRSVNFFSWWYSVYYNSYIFDGACFLNLQWNLSAFWHFTSLKVCQIFFLMIYSNSFFVDGICFFEWQWNLRRVVFLFLVCFNGRWWIGEESWQWWREGGGW